MQRKYKPSVMTNDESHCYICGSSQRIEWHHIFPSGLRKKSTEYGMVVPLCRDCHQGPHGVHSDITKMNWLRAKAQERFEEVYPDEDFLKVFKRNWK